MDPLRFTAASSDSPYRLAPVTWSGLNMRFHALKPAENKEGYILRISEASGQRGKLSLSTPSNRPWQVCGWIRASD